MHSLSVQLIFHNTQLTKSFVAAALPAGAKGWHSPSPIPFLARQDSSIGQLLRPRRQSDHDFSPPAAVFSISSSIASFFFSEHDASNYEN